MNIVPLFGISFITSSIPPLVLVYWRIPSVESYKVNTDRWVKDGFTYGGKIIRNSSGQCVCTFFSSHDECPILEAKLRTILDGIILALKIVLLDLWIEAALLWPFNTSPEVEHFGLFKPLFATLDISLPSTVILFLTFIARVTR
ncbi:Uncharacterized protein Adt_31499 [Abeliophyllum distichum]|uniref:Uncharacterized protein n=1 Tax=Abeliophyllum distichum TaxID=126358 RepID=A0ABD1RG35_9LAMI